MFSPDSQENLSHPPIDMPYRQMYIVTSYQLFMEPIIKFEEGGKASLLSYNVPEPTSYEGQLIVSLEFPPEFFKPELLGTPVPPLNTLNLEVPAITAKMREGFADPNYFPNFGVDPGFLMYGINNVEGSDHVYCTDRTWRLSDELMDLTPEIVSKQMKAGLRLSVTPLINTRTLELKWIRDIDMRPRVILVEKYRLSSFLGNYGAGRTINTFSLFPGEKTKIMVKSFKKTAETRKDTSSILDSFSEESAKDFEDRMEKEESDRKSRDEKHAWSVEAQASGNWGVASVSVKAGYNGSVNSAREQFSKNVSNSTQKHSAKANNKRDVTVTSSKDVVNEETEENVVEREIQNINVGRTLNIVFRQMNQEFVTLLHLTDVQVGFTNGKAESAIIYPIYRLEELLAEIINGDVSTPTSEGSLRKDKVRDVIVKELSLIFDYNDDPKSLIEKRHIKDDDGNTLHAYFRVRKDLVSTYKNLATGAQFSVPGIILSATNIVMRTEGVIAEAILGQGNGLDDYSKGLQENAVRENAGKAKLINAQAAREVLAQKLVSTKDKAGAEIFAMVFPAPKEEEDEDENA